MQVHTGFYDIDATCKEKTATKIKMFQTFLHLSSLSVKTVTNAL